MDKQDNNSGNRSSIIQNITTPLHFFALIALIVEGLLIYFATKADPKDMKTYIFLMVGLLVVSIAAVYSLELKKKRVIPKIGEAESPNAPYKYDLFLAAPMAALKDQDAYTAHRAKTLEIIKVLETECGMGTIFYAGKNIESTGKFDDEAISAKGDIEAIKSSKKFMLIYTEKIVSSVLFEAGVSLAFGKPSFYFGNTNNFPFLMKQVNNAFPHVKIYDVSDLDEIIEKLKTNKEKIFDL